MSTNPSFSHPSATNAPNAPPLTVRNRRLPAWMMSLLLHSILLALLLLLLSSTDRGGSETENRTGGIVLVDAQSETTEYLDEGEVLDANESSEMAIQEQQSPPPLASDSELPPDLPGLDVAPSPITGTGEGLLESFPSAESMLDGPAPSLQIGGKVTTEVFGIKGTGSRFVYVFDRSKSMEGYDSRPLIAARRALLQSLDSLAENHQFQIVFYNDSVTVFNPDGRAGMCFATDDNKNLAIGFVESIRGDRGTDHLNALKHAFRLAPDVIFLLTDAEGGFTTAELREVGNLNRSAAAINTIEFGERKGGDGSLQKLSTQSGGQYLFKNVKSLTPP
jgi:hypothetical protein